MVEDGEGAVTFDDVVVVGLDEDLEVSVEVFGDIVAIDLDEDVDVTPFPLWSAHEN